MWHVWVDVLVGGLWLGHPDLFWGKEEEEKKEEDEEKEQEEEEGE